tara:strand:- start:245 stop:904 length:660 start_codon:yes stop_codon:yes gene_type:complete
MAADSKSSPTRPPAPPAPVSFLKGNIVTKISGTGKGVSGIVVEVDANNRKIVMQTTDGQRFTSQSANNFALVGTAESTSAIIEANMPAPLSSPVGALEKQVSGGSSARHPPFCPHLPRYPPQLADMTIERDEAIAQRDDFSARLDAAENKLHAVMGALNTPTKAAAESPTKNNSSKVCLAPRTPHHQPECRPPTQPRAHSRTATRSTRMMARRRCITTR